jgi:CoA:oxalate CoA-transferase
MRGALDGITVIEAGLLVQGPQAAALLSDMGANVIKVELPNIGDQSRWIPISAEDPRSAYFIGCNRGKQSVTVDLRVPQGAAIFKKMAETADVVISNFQPGTLDEWGLGYEDLAGINPRLIWAAGSTFGPVGPDSRREGADLAGQCAGGIISTIGREEDPPSPIGVTIADHIASLNLVSGVLAALYSRAQTGHGQRVDVSLLGGQIWAQASEYTHYLSTGEQQGRSNFGHPLLRGLYGIFRTADNWLGLVGIPLKSREAFFAEIDRPELLEDSRLLTAAMSHETYHWIHGELSEAFLKKTTDEWCRILNELGVRYAPVRDYQQVVSDPGAWENGYFAEVDDGTGKMQRVVGNPIRMSRTPLSPGAIPPELGANTEEVLLALGYDWDDIGSFREEGAI